MDARFFARRHRLGTALATGLLSLLLLTVLLVAPSPALAGAGEPSGWALAGLVGAPASALLAIRAVRTRLGAALGYLALGLGFVLSIGGFGLARIFGAR